jgi:hypothetical protein
VLSFFPIPKKFPIPIHIWELLGIIGNEYLLGILIKREFEFKKLIN